MKIRERRGFGPLLYGVMSAVTLGVFVLCVCAGSVAVPLKDTVTVVLDALLGRETAAALAGTASIILHVRLPRVICVMLTGAALSLCGSAMQGLLRNPLADGSTLGVSSGASLGAVLAIALGIVVPGVSGGSVMVTAIAFAFVSLVIILGLAHRLDYSLATNTIILIGVVFSMFSNSMMSLIIAFAGEKVKNITFWTMGSLAGSGYVNAAALAAALLICGTLIVTRSRELNAFAVGEDNARHVGVDVRKVKLIVLIAVSVLIGVCVSVGGTIGFVGLIIPHITRMLTGPNHVRLLPISMFAGGVFLMLADLVSRIIIAPLELPIGVVTSLVGSVVFVYVFYRSRRMG